MDATLCGQPEAQALLYSKMSKVLAAVQRVPKNGVNSHFGYKFVRESDLTDAIRTHLAEHNLCVFFGASDILESRPTDGKAGSVTTVRMTATFACGDSGAKFTTSWIGSGQDTGDKGVYKALTGGVKYLLLKTFLVSSGDDPEAQSEYPEDTTGPRRHEPSHLAAADFVMPFGKSKGKPIADLAYPDLMSAVEWAQSKKKFLEFQAAANEYLADYAAPTKLAVPLSVA